MSETKKSELLINNRQRDGFFGIGNRHTVKKSSNSSSNNSSNGSSNTSSGKTEPQGLNNLVNGLVNTTTSPNIPGTANNTGGTSQTNNTTNTGNQNQGIVLTKGVIPKYGQTKETYVIIEDEKIPLGAFGTVTTEFPIPRGLDLPGLKEFIGAVSAAIAAVGSTVVAVVITFTAVIIIRTDVTMTAEEEEAWLRETEAEREKGNSGTEEETNTEYPGNDPSKPPSEDYEWRGKGEPGSGQGNWYNPKTGESLHPDIDHPDPIGPHWDYKTPDGKWYRIHPDGSMLPK